MGTAQLHLYDPPFFFLCYSCYADGCTAYWISDAFNAATWQFASSIIAVGLSWRESLIIVAISFFIMSFVIAGNGAVGAIYHIPFPVISRASWGFWGSYVAIVSRVILALFWFAIQNVNGGNAVRAMIGAIWPSFLRVKNEIPEDQGITTNGMVGYFIFWLFQLPFLCIHPNKVRWLFVVKSVLVPIAWIAILIWAFVAEGGGKMFEQKATVSGSQYSWVFLASMTSVLGNYATLSVNQVCRLMEGDAMTNNRSPTFLDTRVLRQSGSSYTSLCCLSCLHLSRSSALPPPQPATPDMVDQFHGIRSN